MSDLSKDKKIKKEYAKLKKIFQNVPENQRKVIDNLMQNAAFMAVSLAELQNEINANGYTDTYQNGAEQYGTKQSENVKIHLAMQKNYTAVINKLLELLPEEQRQNSRLDAFRRG